MRHADSVHDLLVLHGDVVVGGVNRAWRAGRVRETDGDAHGAADAGGEVGAVEVGGVLLGGGLRFGGRLEILSVASLLGEVISRVNRSLLFIWT